MSRTPWYESENPDRVAAGAASRVGLWVVVAVLFFGLLGIGGWAFKVATSDVKGQGDAVVQKNSAQNRIAAQARFESLYADIKATDRKLDIYADAVKAQPGDKTARTNLDGTRAYCEAVVGDYNAEARKYLAADFKAIDLPSEIDVNDPTTDCKPSEEN